MCHKIFGGLPSLFFAIIYSKNVIKNHPIGWFVELITRFELVTSSLPRKCSTS